MKTYHLVFSLGLLFLFCAGLAIARRESAYAVGWTSMLGFFFVGLARDLYKASQR